MMHVQAMPIALQNGGECFCGNSYGTQPQYIKVEDHECGSTLLGEAWRNAIYENAKFRLEYENSGNIELHSVPGRSCGTEVKDLGTFQSALECAKVVAGDIQCTEKVFMWSHGYRETWGCRCCTSR